MIRNMAMRSVMAIKLLAAGLGFMVSLVCAQMIPDAPIRHFILPFFGDNGYKTWELRGLSGELRGEDVALIESLELRVFSGDERVLQENIIRSPHATLFLKEARAEGQSSLFVSGNGYEMSGRNWTWSGSDRRIEIRESARVTFSGGLNILN